MQTIYYTTVNGGDGSAYVQFFDSRECIDLLKDHDPEGYGMGEGGYSFNVEGIISGITITTLAEVREELGLDCENDSE